MEAVRLRLVFPRRRRILSETQKSEELNKSWFLLKPTIHHTIADVSSHLTRIFNLTHSCPYGISLFMDDFVLPPFESTSILKDRDLIRVKMKKERIDGVNLIKGEAAEKNSTDNDVLLLENDESDDETDSYQNQLEDRHVTVTEDLLHVNQSVGQNAGSKKRKTSKKLQTAKVKRKKKTSTETAENANEISLTGKKEVTEKQYVADEELEKETNVNLSELQEKQDDLAEGLLLVKNSAVKEVVPKKRKASKELESPNDRKKKKHALIHQDIETNVQAEPCHSLNSDRKNGKSSAVQKETESDFHVEQNEPNQCSGLSSGINVDNIKKVSDLESKHERESAPSSAEGNAEFVVPFPITKSVLHETGTESNGVPHTSKGIKKVSKSTRRIYEKRKFRKELKAEAKELLAEKVLVPHKHSPETDIATSQHYQNGVVVGPGHIRFEPYEKGNVLSLPSSLSLSSPLRHKSSSIGLVVADEDVQKSRGAVETCESFGTTSKRKNRNLSKEKKVYCTRSKCKGSSEEYSQVMTIEKAKPQDDLTEFNRLPLLTSCPKEGDVVAYRVLEQSSDTGPILSSFRVGKTLRLDNWAKTLLLTPIDENPVTSVRLDKGAWEQHQDNSVDEESGCIEIDVASLYDVRIVKHAPGNEVDVWDSLSQASSVKNSLLTRKREWGKVGPNTTSSKHEWAKVGPNTTSSNNKWENVGPNTTSSKQDWVKVCLNTTSFKQDPTTTLLKKEWGKAGAATSSWKKEGGKAGPTTSSWSSKPSNDAKQSQNGHSKSKW